MEKWEYKTISTQPESGIRIWDIESELNRLGQEGWELASSTNDASNYAFFVLKRKIQ